MQLERRQALAVQQRRRRWIVAGAIAVLAVTIIGTAIFIQHRQQAFANISVYSSVISLTQDSGSNLASIDRQTNPTVYYHVTLSQVPIGEKLSL